jgi:hypothetical protein
MSYTGLTTKEMNQAELDLKIAERASIQARIEAGAAADVMNVLAVQRSLLEKDIRDLIEKTGSTDFSNILDPNVSNPLCIFGIKARYKPGGDYTFTTQWGDSRSERHVSNTILSMVGSNLDYTGTSFSYHFKGIEMPFQLYNMPFSDEYTLANEQIYIYNDSNCYNYPPIMCGILPLRNTTESDIDITVRLYASLSNSTTYTYGGIFYYEPDVTNSNRDAVSSVTWNAAYTTTSNGDRNALTTTITVPANKSIMVVGMGYDRYYTTQTLQRSFGWGNIADIYPAGIVADEDLAKCLLNINKTSNGRFDSFVDIFKTLAV